MAKVETKADKQKKKAGALVQGWVNGRLENYEEPKRRGVPKGGKIGVSKKMAAAALYQGALFPFFDDDEIAALAGVARASLRTWRSGDPVFDDLSNEAADDLARCFARTIDMALMSLAIHTGEISQISDWDDEPPVKGSSRYDLFETASQWKGGEILFDPDELAAHPKKILRYLMGCLSALSFRVKAKVQDFITSRIVKRYDYNQESGVYGQVFYWLEESLANNDISKKRFLGDFLVVKKAEISGWFDVLMTPAAWTPENALASKEYASKLKESIFSMFDVLAGKGTKSGEDADVE